MHSIRSEESPNPLVNNSREGNGRKVKLAGGEETDGGLKKTKREGSDVRGQEWVEVVFLAGRVKVSEVSQGRSGR